jgi:NitT/TauT family transport system substrate-binding protein
MNTKLWRSTLKATLLGILVAGAFQARAADKVTFGIPNPSGLSDTTAHLALSETLGYFRQEGLEVEMINFKGSAVLLPQVTTKKVDIGWGGPDILITGKQPGRDIVPLRFFFNWLRSSVWEFVVLDSSPIKGLADLKGKKVGVNFLSGGQIPQTKATLASAGLQVGRDVDLIATGYGPPAFLAITSGQVEALSLFEGQHVALENRGTKLRRLKVPERYERLFSDGFYAHDDTINSRGDVLTRFGRAVAKGIVACDANPEACIRALWKLHPEKKPTAGNEDKQLADSTRVLKARFARIMAFEPGAPRQFGQFPEAPWRDYLQTFKEVGQIANASVPLDQLYTNQFVAEFNRFNADEIRQQARSAK